MKSFASKVAGRRLLTKVHLLHGRDSSLQGFATIALRFANAIFIAFDKSYESDAPSCQNTGHYLVQRRSAKGNHLA